MGALGRDAVIPSPVLTEFDHLARSRVGNGPARQFLQAVAGGLYEVAYLSAGLLRRAAEFDRQYADLNLGLADASLMAIAERRELRVFTFDFRDFRATESSAGRWQLAVDEHVFKREIGK